MNFNFKKKFGQNFINNNTLINNICGLVDVDTNDLIIEIGPGAGALTKVLSEKNTSYICYEIDKELDQYLSKYKSDKLSIIYGDFLQRDISEDIRGIEYDNLFIIGNLPYYITTNILLKLFDDNIRTKKCIFMVQKEFGDRLTAKPGNKEYGSITALLNYKYDIKEELYVDRSLFTPQPNVDSVVISLTQKDNGDLDLVKYKKFIRDAFQFKRKTLRNNLKGYDLDSIESVLNKYDLNLNNRAEDIDVNIFVDIVNTVL